MKKKRSTKSRVRDILVTLLCLSGATLSLWLFWKDFNAVMEKLNELPIATVSWKYRASQRKFSDRLIWDRLQQDSPVYNGDTIRTSEKAETTITFENSEIQLGENTIIQIQVDNTGMTSINMSGGMVAANTSAGSKMQLRSGNVTVDLPANVRAANDFDELSAGTDLVLAALAVDADGKYGEPVNEDFKTKELVYSTTFTATFGEETSTVYFSGYRYNFTVNVEGGTAAKYYYVFSTEQYSAEDLANLPLTYDYDYNFRQATSLNNLYANAESTYYLSVVVESADGELAPVITKTVTVPAVPAE